MHAELPPGRHFCPAWRRSRLRAHAPVGRRVLVTALDVDPLVGNHSLPSAYPTIWPICCQSALAGQRGRAAGHPPPIREPHMLIFRVPQANRRSAPQPASGASAERQRRDRATRRARNLALAFWIDGPIRSGEVAGPGGDRKDVPCIRGESQQCHVLDWMGS